MELEQFDLDEITNDCKAVKIISPAYAGDEGELTAILQYSFQVILLRQHNLIDEAKIVEEISFDEMQHLEILGTIVGKLGATPVYSYLPPYPINFYSAKYVNYTILPQKILAIDIAAEERAIEIYTKMLSKLKNQIIRTAIEEIRKDEIRHLSIFKQLLEKLK